MKPKSKTTRRKIDFAGFVITDEVYLEKISSRAKKRKKIHKSTSETNTPQALMQGFWKSLSPPKLEEDLVGQ